MNFLMMRSNQTAAPEPPPAQEIQAENNNVPKLSTSLDALIAEDPFQHPTSSENCSVEGYNHGNENGGAAGANGKCNHVEVTEDEGWIVIPKSILLFLFLVETILITLYCFAMCSFAYSHFFLMLFLQYYNYEFFMAH